MQAIFFNMRAVCAVAAEQISGQKKTAAVFSSREIQTIGYTYSKMKK